MIISKILEENTVIKIENCILNILNDSATIINERIMTSPRAVGDIVQDIVGERIFECFPSHLISSYNAAFGRRAMEDVAFYDVDENYYVVDVKTHNIDTDFNMPNLTSVQRLSKLYNDDKQYFIILFVEYTTKNGVIEFENVIFFPIENLQWSCLNIGALGWGQIQITNANSICIDRMQTRKAWMLRLCDALEEFYPKEISKIQQRIDYFQDIKRFWENQ